MEPVPPKSEQKVNNHEIELRELIGILLKWKKHIVAATLCSMLLVGLISQFMLAPVYQATIVVAPEVTQKVNESNVNYTIMVDDPETLFELLQIRNEMDKMLVYEPLDPSRFQAILASDIVISRAMKGLGIEDRIKEQSNRVTVELYDDKDAKSDVYKITVQDKDPLITVSIAEALVEEANNLIRETKKEQLSEMEALLSHKLEDSITGLIMAVEDLQLQENESQLGLNDADYSTALIEKQVTISYLQSRIESYQMLVEINSKRLLLIKAHKAFAENEDQLIVLSTPSVPEKPVKPNKMANIAIAGMAGLLLSTFGAFIFEYWKHMETTQC